MDIVGVRVQKKGDFARNISATVNYPDKVEDRDSSEKILYESTFINCRNNERMVAHAATAVRVSKSKDVVEHLVFSFAAHLFPRRENCEKVVSNVMELTGCDQCPVKWTVHQNTENIHIHIVVIRADKDDPSKIVKPSMFIDKVNKAAAKSIYDLRLESGPNAPFFYDGKRFVRGERSNDVCTLSRNARSFEVRKGEKSVERNAKETLGPLIVDVKSDAERWNWAKLHNRINELGYRLETAKGGLVFVDQQTGQGVKGSNLQFSRKQSELLLGRFSPHDYIEKSRLETPPQKTHWQQYQLEKSKFLKLCKDESSVIKNQFDAQMAALKKSYIQQKHRLKENDASIVDCAYAEADFRNLRMKILQQKKKATNRLRAVKFCSWDDYKKHLGVVDVKMTPMAQKKFELGEIYSSVTSTEFDRKDIRCFKARRLHLGVEYSNSAHDPAFVDFGQKIIIHASQDDETLLASMQLACVKWPKGFSLQGSDEFKRRCCEIALDEGIANKILNPEAKRHIEVIQSERRQAYLSQTEEPPSSLSTEVLKNIRLSSSTYIADLSAPVDRSPNEFRSQARDFEPLLQSEKLRSVFNSLATNRSRVCSEKFWFDEQGREQSEWKYFGDRDSNGFYAPLSLDKICHRLADFRSKWQTTMKQSFAIEPVSDTHHLIVLSELSNCDVASLCKDGFHPALIIENEPGKYQIVLTVVKQGSSAAHNQKIGDTLTAQLQARYGVNTDCKLAFVGFDNFRYQTNDGHFQPRLHRAERLDCPALLALSKRICKEVPLSTDPVNPLVPSFVRPSEFSVACQKTANFMYSTFAKDLCVVDRAMSQLDQEITVRMFVLGFTSDQIVEAIISNRIFIDTVVDHDWSVYAQKAVEKVLSTQMDRIEVLADTHLDKWRDQYGFCGVEEDCDSDRGSNYSIFRAT